MGHFFLQKKRLRVTPDASKIAPGALKARSRVPKKPPPRRFLGSFIAQRGAPNIHRGTLYCHKIPPKVTHLRWVTFLSEKNGFEQHQMPPKLRLAHLKPSQGSQKTTPEEIPGVFHCSTRRPKHSQGHSLLPQNPTKSDPSQMGHFSFRKKRLRVAFWAPLRRFVDVPGGSWGSLGHLLDIPGGSWVRK